MAEIGLAALALGTHLEGHAPKIARAGPFVQRPGSAPKRVALARAAVDSVRLRPPDRANWFVAGFGAGIFAGIAVTMTAVPLALAD